ncbi:cysteine hydrolase family protein [Tolumonas lignilytica]|uniref:cysteine hydrolase family protein n=1 Tax=Tolumonas lignilytica TaxID=1283284 RepID=UPI000464A8C6|nr:cysteine hydrolase family protein [Tolumonas lignilytica]
MNKSALLIIDVQNDYFPGGKMALHQPELALEKITELLQYYRQQQWPVIHIQHEMHDRPNRPAAFFLPQTEGQQLHPAVLPAENETLLIKHFPSSFAGTGLLDVLRQQQVEQLIICGMMTHMCVDTTTRAAFDLGFDVQVAIDATATKALAFGGDTVSADQVKNTVAAALHGTFAQVQTTDAILQQLSRP